MKVIYKSLLLIIFFLIIIVFYLSLFGFETKKFNDVIKEKFQTINPNISLELSSVKIYLKPTSLKLRLKTANTKINYNNKQIKILELNTNFPIYNFFNDNLIVSDLEILSGKNEIKNFIKLIREFKNTPRIYLLDKLIKKGNISLNAKLKFNENGELLDDYLIFGNVENLELKFFNKKI